MSVLVTGGVGYLGRHVVAALVERGERVVSYNRDYVEGADERVVPEQGELYDIPRLSAVLRDHAVDRVVHTAALSHPEVSLAMPVATFAANVEGTLSVLEAARLVAGVRRVVNFSSECAYGDLDIDLISEDAPLHPTTPYGVTKVTTELLGEVYGRRYGVSVVSLRPSELYGAGNKMPQYLREMIQAVLAGEPYRLDSGADQRIQYVHVSDVTSATLAALDVSAPARPVYNVTGGSQVTLADAADLVRELVPGADISIGSGLIDGLDVQGRFDLSAAKRDLGWEPAVELRAGVAAYVDWLREHPF